MKSQNPANKNSEPTSRNVNNIMILNKKEIQNESDPDNTRIRFLDFML